MNDFSFHLQVEIPRAFVCAESKIFDVSEWAICQVSSLFVYVYLLKQFIMYIKIKNVEILLVQYRIIAAKNGEKTRAHMFLCLQRRKCVQTLRF